MHLSPQAISPQIDLLLGALARVSSPLVLMGDFNCGAEGRELAPIRHTMADTCRAVVTAGAREALRVGTLVGGARRIDHIFVSREDFMTEDAGLVSKSHRRVSDHRGYFAVVRLKNLSQ